MGEAETHDFESLRNSRLPLSPSPPLASSGSARRTSFKGGGFYRSAL